MKNPSTMFLAKLSLIALLLSPTFSFADMEELVELQREQLQVQKQILRNQEAVRRQSQWMEPSRSNAVQPDLSAEIEEAARNLQYQARKQADYDQNEYFLDD